MNRSALKFDYINHKTNHKFRLHISAFKKPLNQKEYVVLENLLDELIDEVRGDEKHPLAIAIQIIGENLEQYDNEHYLVVGHNINEIDMVKYLMKSHNLHPEIFTHS